MSTFEIVLIAAFSMVIQDAAGTVMVVAEARGRGWLAGILDAVGWIFAITTTFISVDSLSGHDFAKKAAVVLAVSAANIFGTKLGESLGSRFVKDRTIEQRLAALEMAVKP